MRSKKCFYTVLFTLVVFIDWLYATQNGYHRMIAANSIGIIMGALTLRCYPYRKERYVKPDIIWLILWGVGSVIGGYVWYKVKGPINEWQYIVAAVDVGILGFSVIRVILANSVKRILSSKQMPIAIIWGTMSLWMVCSRYYEIWQIWFWAMFLCFYLTRMDEDESVMWDSVSIGFICAFFMIQIWTYGFRPYDEVRYLGPYSNTNMAALFYLVTYMMVLYRIHVLHLKERESNTAKKWTSTFWKIFYYVLAGGLVSFIFFTICRTALLVVFGLTFLFGVISNIWLLKEKVYCLFLRWMALVLCAVVTFPCVYGTIRYLPCILHRPVWFGAEYHVDKVHSFDPWDSWKYVSMEEFLETAVGRMSYGNNEMPEEEEPVSEETEPASTDSVMAENVEASASEAIPENVEVPNVTEMPKVPIPTPAQTEVPQAEEMAPVIEDSELLRGEDALDSGKIRMEIWEKYLSNLNMTGHTVDEGHYQITEDFHAWHAQNIFIQTLFYYGIPAGIMFIALMVWYGVKSLMILKDKKDSSVLLPGMVFVVFMGFGMLECVWYFGQAILFLMYLSAKRLLKNDGDLSSEV